VTAAAPSIGAHLTPLLDGQGDAPGDPRPDEPHDVQLRPSPAQPPGAELGPESGPLLAGQRDPRHAHPHGVHVDLQSDEPHTMHASRAHPHTVHLDHQPGEPHDMHPHASLAHAHSSSAPPSAGTLLATVPAGRTAPGEADAWSGGDAYAAALRSGHGPLYLRQGDGRRHPLDVARWCAPPDADDRRVLSACRGAVLDVGCGPGRMVAALAAGGRPALGVDVSAEAVRRTVAAGGRALRRSVFEPLPGEGAWHTVLLLDGNIGIGGDPAALLARARRLVHPRGRLIAESVAPGLPDDLDERFEARFDDGSGPRGEPFPWARVGPGALLRHAAAGGWRFSTSWASGSRRFTVLRPLP
jgi:SAM-dependent methyltransferase